MIINFNFDTSKVEFIWQQNNNKYFAVNFLMEHIASKNFSAIIEEVLASSPDIVEILKKEKTPLKDVFILSTNPNGKYTLISFVKIS